MRPSGTSAVANRAAGVLLSALLLASCAGTGDGEGARPSISPTRTPTAELPSTSETTSASGTEQPGTEAPTTEEPTGEPTSEDSSPELPSPSRTPERTERPEEPETPLTTTLTTTLTPTATATATPTVTEPEPEETSPAQEPEAQEPAEEDVEDDGVPAWAWWLAGALVAAALVAVPLVVRSRRRTAWDRDLAAAEGEVVWLARELLPELRRAASREELAGGWTVSQARVATAEDRLTVLESSAPDEPRRERSRALRDASRASRAQMQRLLGPGAHDTWALDLDAIIIDLETALRPTPAAPPP